MADELMGYNGASQKRYLSLHEYRTQSSSCVHWHCCCFFLLKLQKMKVKNVTVCQNCVN